MTDAGDRPAGISWDAREDGVRIANIVVEPAADDPCEDDPPPAPEPAHSERTTPCPA